MHCIYINLAEQLDRRHALEANFLKNNQNNWTLKRYEAVDTKFVHEQEIKGKSQPAEKACFLSHIGALKKSEKYPGPVMIIEDDSIMGQKTQNIIDNLINTLDPLSWDMMYTDVIITDIHEMILLYKVRRAQFKNDLVTVMNLRQMPTFAGSAAYVINGSSKGKLLNLLTSVKNFDTPYDMVLRQLIWDQKINACVTFPFVTTGSPLSQSSQIQNQKKAITDLTCDLFRKLIWAERSVEEIQEALADLDQKLVDRETAAFADLLKLALSSNFLYI
ncbi:glycosyltransferase family 25 protein [Telmatospirillum siberiense]|uniref:Glycosyl transferase family 25 domain-containing protein n=1 Tax=Telmatospirillum siberiense TaxID=382514 RepID=A0A2N3Q074_9PROT|nr:glycosyltransferase family 25 protein [Telmatospirillum siberiense]PKU26054.1 hypothetical protein CWS72_02645 [Telmatospirillum siberiense]